MLSQLQHSHIGFHERTMAYKKSQPTATGSQTHSKRHPRGCKLSSNTQISSSHMHSIKHVYTHKHTRFNTCSCMHRKIALGKAITSLATGVESKQKRNVKIGIWTDNVKRKTKLTGSVRHAFIKLTSAMRYKVKESLKVKYKGTVHSLRFTYRVKVFAKKKNYK